MKNKNSFISQKFVGIVIAIGLPAIACTGLYSLDYISGEGALMQTLIILAYPTALIGMIGLAMAILSTDTTRNQYIAWLFVIFIPLSLHLMIRIT